MKTKEEIDETFEEFEERNRDKIDLFKGKCNKPYINFGRFPSIYLYPLIAAMESYATQEREKAEAEKKEFARKAWVAARSEEYYQTDSRIGALSGNGLRYPYFEEWLSANNLNEPKPVKP